MSLLGYLSTEHIRASTSTDGSPVQFPLYEVAGQPKELIVVSAVFSSKEEAAAYPWKDKQCLGQLGRQAGTVGRDCVWNYMK